VIPVERCLLLYSSLSQVQRVKRRLLEKGIFVDMLRAPQCLASRGCAFALRCDPPAAPLIRDVSHELSIEIQGAFLEPAAGADRFYVPYAYGPIA
jgi:hypothetical protein